MPFPFLQRYASESVKELETRLSAARALESTATADVAKVSALTATEIDQARRNADAAAQSRLESEGLVSSAEASIASAEARLAEERAAAKKQRASLTSRITAMINTAKSSRAAVMERVQASRKAAAKVLREAGSAKDSAARSAAQLHATLSKNEASLKALQQTLSNLKV